MSFLKKLFGRKSRVVTDPDKIPDAFKQQAPVLDAIGAEAISCTPENWTNAVLTISCDGTRIDYSLKNHAGQGGKAVISRQLASLAEQLYSLMASQGNRWVKAELRYDRGPSDWKFKSKFTY